MTPERKIAFENEVMELIAQQVSDGYYSGMFDLYEDETDCYIPVDWELKVNISWEDE